MTREQQIEFAKRQFQVFQSFVLYHNAVAMTSKDEKIVESALACMKRHIHLMNDANDGIAELECTTNESPSINYEVERAAITIKRGE